MTVDPRLIMQFQAVAEHGSITRAAQAIGLSQPALSNGIALLERSLGTRLLDRTHQGSKLTDFGIAVSRSACALNSLLLTMVDELEATAAGTTCPLSIGVTPIAAAILVPDAVDRLTTRLPELTISIFERNDDQLSDMLFAGKVEVIVGPVGVDKVPPTIIEERLLQDPFAVIVREGHRLSGLTAIRMSELADEKWIFPDQGSAYRRHVEAIFLTAGVPVPHASINTNSRSMIEELLLRTDRVAIMPSRLINRDSCVGLKCIDLLDAGAPRGIGTKRLRNVPLSRGAAELLTILGKISQSDNYRVPRRKSST